MSPDPTGRRGWHSERAMAVIAREAARFIAREAASDPLITVIRAMSLRHGSRIGTSAGTLRVIVFVNIFPEEKTRLALAFLEQHREAFSNYLKSHARLGPLPRIDFQVDNGEQADTLSRGPGGN